MSEYRWVWVLLLSLFLLHLAVIAGQWLPVNIEEAQYSLWSHHLAAGYHSKPPLIAWVIALSRHLFSSPNSFQLRFFSPVFYFVTAIFIFLSTRVLFNREIASWAALSFYVMPSVSLGSLLMTTDSVMLMFFSMAFYFFTQALRERRWWHWTLAAIFCGLSGLGKYTGLFFVPSLLIFLLVTPAYRHEFRKRNLYGFLVVVFIVILPNLWWNWRHGGASFRHLFFHNVGVSHFGLHPIHLANFLLSQFFVFSVILFVPLLRLFVRHFRVREDWRQSLLVIFSLPVLLLISLQALLNRAYANWAVLTYLCGMSLVVAVLIERKKLIWLKVNLIVSLVLTALFYVFLMLYSASLIPTNYIPKTLRGPVDWQAFHRWYGAASVQIRAQHWLFDNRKLWAMASYHAQLPYSKIAVMSSAGGFAVDAHYQVNHTIDRPYLFMTRRSIANLSINHVSVTEISVPLCKKTCSVKVYFLKPRKSI